METSKTKKTQDVETLFQSVDDLNGFLIAVQSKISGYEPPIQLRRDLLAAVQELNRQILLGINWIINPAALDFVDAVKERAAKIEQKTSE